MAKGNKVSEREMTQKFIDAIEAEIKRATEVMKQYQKNKDYESVLLYRNHINKRYVKLEYYKQLINPHLIQKKKVADPWELTDEQKAFVKEYYGKLSPNKILNITKCSVRGLSRYVKQMNLK